MPTSQVNPLIYKTSQDFISATTQDLSTLPPYVITINNHTFEHKYNDNYFTNPHAPLDEEGKLEEFTPHSVLEQLFPNVYQKGRVSYNPPHGFLDFGRTIRYKILRCVQASKFAPPPTELSDQLLPFFDEIKYRWDPESFEFAQHWTATRWAIDNDRDAAAHFLHYGRVQRFDDYPTPSSSIFKMTKDTEAVTIDVHYPHTFQERVNAACLAAFVANETHLNKHKLPAPIKELEKIAFSTFWIYQGYHCCLIKDVRFHITSLINSYLIALSTDAIRRPGDKPLPTPQIKEPEDTLPEQIYKFYYIDFTPKKHSVTETGLQQRRDNNNNKSYEIFLSYWGHLPKKTLLKKSDLPEVPKNNFTTWKKLNFIISPKQGYVIIR